MIYSIFFSLAEDLTEADWAELANMLNYLSGRLNRNEITGVIVNS